MAGGETGGVDLTRKFVTEAELDDKRKKRQEEWERVRKPEDPQGENFARQRISSCFSILLNWRLINWPDRLTKFACLPADAVAYYCYYFVAASVRGPGGRVRPSIPLWATAGTERQKTGGIWGAIKIQWVHLSLQQMQLYHSGHFVFAAFTIEATKRAPGGRVLNRSR